MVPQAQPPSRKPVTAILALGANQRSSIGNQSENLDFAMVNLLERIGGGIRKSRVYRTPAFPAGAGPDFANAVVAFDTDMAPDDVLAMCHDIERMAQRTREKRWGQRTLDIDLIAYDQVVIPSLEVFAQWRDLPIETQMLTPPDQLILPHPRIQDRSFVLVPMMDVVPDWRHPVLALSTREMLAVRPAAEKASVTLWDMA